MPQAYLKYQLLGELLSLLEKERFSFGVDRHLKLQELWAKLPEDLPIEQLKEALCPAIAINEQQQDLFYELFDEAWERVQAMQILDGTSEDPPPSHWLKWLIALVATVLLGIIGLLLWSLFQVDAPIEKPIIRPFTIQQGDTTIVDPNDIRTTEWGFVRQSYFCADSIGQNTRDSSAFGHYTLILGTLEYIAKDSLGQDSICVTMIDSAGKAHTVFFKPRVIPKLEALEDTTQAITQNVPKQKPLFVTKTLPNFDDEIKLLQIEPPSKLEQIIAENIEWLRWTFIGLTLFLLGLILYKLEQQRRTLVAQLESQDKPPYVWNIELQSELDILKSDGFDRMVNALRQRTREDHFQIDIPKTVSATIDQAGMPTLAYRQQTRPPEYLMLIDRQSGANHRSKLFDWIYQVLLEQEVFVERYFFDGDIRICFNEKNELGISITELQYLHPNARLLIFSHGFQLLSRGGKMAKWTQIFDQWKQKILFSSRPTQQWGRRENRLRDKFVLLPASMEGLQFFAQEAEDLEELPINAWKDIVSDAHAQPIALDGGLISSLRQYYSEAVIQWIACCAVYPALHWDLTLFMGQQLSTDETPLLTVDHLTGLTRLPWFVEGRIPEETRVVLVDYLEREHPATLQKAREGLLTILQQNPPPEDSNAWDDYQMQLALNEWLSTKDAKRKKELEKQIEDLLNKGVEADFVTLKYLEEPGPLDFIVPQSWKKYVYKSGYSGLGMRRWLKDLWWALPLWLAIVVGSIIYEPPEGCSEDVTPYEGKTLCLNADWKKLLYQKFLAKSAIDLDNRDSLLAVTSQINGFVREEVPFPNNWYTSEDNILALSNQQIDSLDGPLKSMYAVATFNQYVARYHYNKGVLFANTADSLIRTDDQKNYQSYQDSACYHFSEAWPLDTADVDIKRAHRFCLGVEVFVQLDQGLEIAFGERIKESLHLSGFPAFGVEKVTTEASTVRYFYPQDSIIAKMVLQTLQDTFNFEGEIGVQYVQIYEGIRENVDTGQVEVWIDDNQPTEVLLNGEIVDAAAGQPVPRAQITWNNQTVTSDQQGAFSLRIAQPIPNQITIRVRAENYQSANPSFSISNITDLGMIELTPIPEFVSVALNRQVVDGANQTALANVQVQSGGRNVRTKENGDFQLNLELPRDTSLPVYISIAQYRSDTLSLQVQNGLVSLRNQQGSLINVAIPLFSLVADRDNDKVPDTEDRCPTLAGNANNQGCPNAITDNRDNQAYPVVIIGEQVWLGKNLNYATDSSWCYLELPQACQRAGRLYTWEAAKNACPAGWHLPTDEEWQQLATNAGGYYDFIKSKEIGDENAGNRQLIEGGSSNFNALLGGYRNTDGSFLDLGAYGFYWSATEPDGGYAYYFDFYGDYQRLSRYYSDQGFGLSVRCLQN